MPDRKKFKVDFMVRRHLIVEMPRIEDVRTWADRVVDRKENQGEEWRVHTIEEVKEEDK